MICADKSQEKLRRLYKLRYLEGIEAGRVLAEKLEISIDELQNYLLQLKEMLEEGLKRSSKGAQFGK